MEKGYAYLTTTNVENDFNAEEQYVLVQDDGTFMSVNKPLQYVTQIQVGKEVLESVGCPVYDVSLQPYNINLNEPPGLVPICSNQMQPGSSSVAHNYMLPNSNVELIQAEIDSNNLKDTNQNMNIADANKQMGSYAEITLSDEQYEILKQKGWILLEIKDRVFLLDSSGLHEITDDHKLITKLKEESQLLPKDIVQSGCDLKVVMIPREFDNLNMSNVSDKVLCNPNEPLQMVTQTSPIQQMVNTAQEICYNNVKTEPHIQISEDKSVHEKILLVPALSQDNADKTSSGNYNSTASIKNKPNRIHLKSQYLLKDIPKEVVLGKTVNGKNLIARVVKGKGFFKNAKRSRKEVKSDEENDCIINEKHLEKLVQQVLLNKTENYSMENISAAETVVSQLLHVPEFESTLHKYKLIITKTLREENEDGLIEKQSEPSIITGRLVMNENEGRFVHIPEMLQQHMRNSELKMYDSESQRDKKQSENLENMFLHVNITETRSFDNISRISVMVNKRYLSLNKVYNMGNRHLKAVYACSACARVFKSLEAFKEHQEYQCSGVPKVSSADEQSFSVIKSHNNTRLYMCNQCKEKFAKRKDCQIHIQTHHNENNPEDANAAKYLETLSEENKQAENVYKCKLCSNTYFHSSSLTKHILVKHVNI